MVVGYLRLFTTLCREREAFKLDLIDGMRQDFKFDNK